VASATTKYVPPHLRAQAADPLSQLRRPMKGILNRLNETSLAETVASIERMYMVNARKGR
jgi:hypothetical protein